MNADDLFDALHASKIEQSELAQVLLAHFHNAAFISENELAYHHDAREGNAITLTFKHNVLVGIIRGPQLRPEDMPALRDTIENQLLRRQSVRVGREVLFARVPVAGFFRYEDRFQICPVGPDAPRPEQLIGEHPFLLEFQFETSPNGMIRMARRTRFAREIELLLTGFLEFSIHSLGITARWHWVAPQSDPSGPWQSKYLQERYTWPGLELEGNEFMPAGDIPALKEVRHEEYYNRGGISLDRTLEIPSDLGNLFTRFYALPKPNQEQFLRACFWLQYANRTNFYSRSGAFTALISAVESIMPDEVSSAECLACHRRTGPGLTQRFADFVEQLAPGFPQNERKRFYGIRSKLSHGGSLLPSDVIPGFRSMGPEQAKEWDDISTIWRLVRIVLVNWLCADSTTNSPALPAVSM